MCRRDKIMRHIFVLTSLACVAFSIYVLSQPDYEGGDFILVLGGIGAIYLIWRMLSGRLKGSQ